jgi:aminoglycoside phosphotransferase family enzyme
MVSEAPVQDTQDEVIAFLRRPASYGLDRSAVEIVETHCSVVFLAGDRAYKLKRAVKYPYLDFSTPERRQAACEAELALNRRTAPELYLEVKAIGRRPDGMVGWDGEGAPLDWVVVMRRFDQRRLLDQIAEAGKLSAPLMLALAAHIAEFHADAEPCPQHGGAAAMAEVAQTNIGILRDCRSAGFAAAEIDKLHERIHEELARAAPRLDQRRARGKVRRCHGDLHLRNICVVDGRPVLFDCIEFSEAIASVDVLYDLAFLLMDLDHRGHRTLANLTLNRYLDLTVEDDGLAALPAFLALRAVIRAHVTATAAEHGWGSGDRGSPVAEARRYVEEAEATLRPARPRLVAIGGLSGSGKSTLAGRLAPALGVPPGARVLRSDVLRKRRFGVMPEAPLPSEAYSVEGDRIGVSRTVRARRDRARRRLCGGDRRRCVARRGAPCLCRCRRFGRRAVHRPLARRADRKHAGADRRAPGRRFRRLGGCARSTAAARPRRCRLAAHRCERRCRGDPNRNAPRDRS